MFKILVVRNDRLELSNRPAADLIRQWEVYMTSNHSLFMGKTTAVVHRNLLVKVDRDIYNNGRRYYLFGHQIFVLGSYNDQGEFIASHYGSHRHLRVLGAHKLLKSSTKGRPARPSETATNRATARPAR